MPGDVVAIVTARGGSKGLPGKNLRLLRGAPLVAHSIRAGLGSRWVERCVVSTDDEAIRAVSLKWGAEVIDRPVELATDGALSQDVVRHALAALEREGRPAEHFVLLQPTSPLRTAAHVDACLDRYFSSAYGSAISVTACEHHPFKCFVDDGGTLRPVHDLESLHMPRQLLPGAYRQNGAIYAAASRRFLECGTFFLPPVCFHVMAAQDSIDIDTEDALREAERLLAAREHPQA